MPVLILSPVASSISDSYLISAWHCYPTMVFVKFVYRWKEDLPVRTASNLEIRMPVTGKNADKEDLGKWRP